MTSSRQTILDFLESKRAATPLEIGQALHMTTANVRHHLAILVSEGVVETIGERTAGKRGRPAKLFALTSLTRQHNLDELANALLEEFLDQKPPADQQVFLRRIARILADPDKTAGKIPQRFYRAINRLNEMRYNAHWEAHAQAPFLILRHCPYSCILPMHPVLCQMDAYLIQELLDKPAQLVEKLAKDNTGATYCKFIIKE
jgi:predicted ArsR family transcriptional regulator